MFPPTSGGPHLDVDAALREGWTAFGRAPWILGGFLLLSIALHIALDFGQTALTMASTDPAPSLPLVPLLFALASWVLNLWTVVGLVRGAWITLEGRRPAFLELVRWDGPAIGRVLLASVLLGLILTLIALPLFWLLITALNQLMDIDLTVAGLVVRNVTPTPTVILRLILSTLALVGLITYAQVNQHFLVQLASLGGTGPWRTLREGHAVVGRQWWPTLGLVALETALLVAGFLALLLGLFVAVPVVFCVATAAYRQLFESEWPALPG
jgi:hypothetical protein